MDLGSLELQIFVSLTVVLGGAFVALVCDYLKGNNEQLREHNIELRVRKEEQERRMLLDPAGFIGQWLSGNKAATGAEVPVAAPSNARTVAVHEVMQSFAAQEALREAEARAAMFHARGGEEPYESAEVPPLTPRRKGRSRATRKGTRVGRSNGAPYADGVRPEVITRVASKSEAAAAYGPAIRDELEVSSEAVRPAAELVQAAVQATPAATVSAIDPEIETASADPRLSAENAARSQEDIERVAQLEQQSVATPPGTILRPLTVPSLSLREEIQRVAETPVIAVPLPAVWHSPLLDEVIAASGMSRKEKANARIIATELEETITPQPVSATEPKIEAEIVVRAETVVAQPPVESVQLPALEFDKEQEPDQVAAEESLGSSESPSFVFAIEEEVAPVAPESPIVAEETVVSTELPGITFASEDKTVPVIAEAPFIAEDAVESIELPAFGFPGEEFESAAATASAITTGKFESAVDLEQTSLAFNLLEEPMDAGAFVPAVPVTEGSPVAVNRTLSQTEASLPVEPPPFVHSFEEHSTLPDHEPLSFELPEQELEPQPFTFVMDVEPRMEKADPPVVITANEAEVPPMAAFENYGLDPRLSAHSGMGVTPPADYLSVLPQFEKPTVSLSLADEPALAMFASRVGGEAGPQFGTFTVSSDLNAQQLPGVEHPPSIASAATEPPRFWAEVTRADSEAVSATTPIDISVARQPESIPPDPAPNGNIPDLLLPTGMHDLSTWTRLMSLPNPMTGILFVITLQPSDTPAQPERKGATPPPDTGPAVEKLMASFVREGDFGTRIADNEWIFIYNHDIAGFNQRRVGMISEKLWDFQLRHLGMANVSFKWGAVDVQSEKLSEALQAVRDRMNQTRRARKLPGADTAASRRAVNA